MTFARLTAPLALAVAAAASPAWAAQTFNGSLGNLNIDLTADGTSVLDTMGVTSEALPGTTTTVATTAVTNSDGSTSNYLSFGNTATSVTAQDAAIQSVQAGSSGVVLARGTTDRTVTLSNFDFDPTNVVLYADMATTQGTYLHEKFLVASSDTTASGNPATLSTDGVNHYTAEGSFSAMTLAGTWDGSSGTGALDILRRGWNVPTVLVSTIANVQFASVSTQLAVATPEPSTYALVGLGLGLVAAGAVARRRRATV
ncbi:PEP-CTERM sorting domain-containing protein [Aquabacterium sp.]|uniref:PEP-CTERM sorting domain-containing protein n=1 Tax=Aquabacterium sp. TaxID=1872578 RepID=UPI0035B1BDBC